MYRTLLCLAVAVVVSCAAQGAPTKVELGNAHYKIVMDSAKPGVIRIDNLRMGSHSGILTPGSSQPFFAMTVQEAYPQGKEARTWKLSSTDFVTTAARTSRTKQGPSLIWEMHWKSGDIRIEVRLTAQSDASSESVWQATIRSNSDLDINFAFPIFDGLQIGPVPERAWYFHPRWSGVLNDVPTDLATTYGQYARMQVMAASNPAGAGAGKPAVVYIVTRDTTMARKTYELVKRVPGVEPVQVHDFYYFPFYAGFKATQGIGMAVNWTRIALQPGKTHTVSPVVIGIGAGDWRDALESYRKWARTWCPVHTRAARDCFRHCFYRMFNEPSADAALAVIDAARHPDYLQFMVQNVHINGEYGYREDWGLPEIQRFVQECKNRGILTNHYVEGGVVHHTSSIWKEKGDQWGHMRGDEFQIAFSNQSMWLAHPEWHEWLAVESSRLARDLKLDSIYLDEIGFGTSDKAHSDNPRHNPGRFQPDGAMTGVRDLLRTVRKSIDQVNPGISIYTEGPAVDGLFPYLDGVEDYSCRQWNSKPKTYRIPVHFLRFAFPDVKFADIPEGTGEAVDRQVRMCLFNGIGTFTSLAPRNPAKWVERIHVVEKENRDAFNDMSPTPLVPTLVEGVYCNRFASPAKTIFTLFNANEYRAAGQVLNLPAAKTGHHWVELVRSRNLRTDEGRWGARAVLDMLPGDVAVIAEFPSILKLRMEGDRVWLTETRLNAGEKIVLVLVDEDGVIRETESCEAGPEGLSLAEATRSGEYQAVLKLYRDDLLVDMVELPSPALLDLSADAQASGSVRTEQAERVIGKSPGVYRLSGDEKERWVQLTWERPQPIAVSELRFSTGTYSPQTYTYLTSEDGIEWNTVAEVDRYGRPSFYVRDLLPGVTTRFLRLRINKGGVWADRSDIVHWKVFSVRGSGEVEAGEE